MNKKKLFLSLALAGLVVGLGCGVPVSERQSEPSIEPLASTGGIPAQPVPTGGKESRESPVTGGSASSGCVASDVIRLVGNKIYDSSGALFVGRGPELVVASLDQMESIDAIADSGANAMRMLLTLDAANGMTPNGFDSLIRRAVSRGMVVWVSLFVWDEERNHAIGDALGGGNFYSLSAPSGTVACSHETPTSCYLAVWSRAWLKDLMAKHKRHVIIDAMQEFINDSGNSETEAGRGVWADAAKANIAFFRAAGYVHPLEIMSNYEGRDLYATIEKGAEIRAADTLKVGADPQTMFGWQAYWASDWYKGWQGDLLLGGKGSLTGAEAIHRFASTQSFPIQIGIDNYGGDTGSEYPDEIKAADSEGASWLWWSWKDDVQNVECPVDGNICQSYVKGSKDGFSGTVRFACAP